jgi:hypothetical protein
MYREHPTSKQGNKPSDYFALNIGTSNTSRQCVTYAFRRVSTPYLIAHNRLISFSISAFGCNPDATDDMIIKALTQAHIDGGV